jgi:acyl-CoA reductase-like NAD-dependent aldehyde dehydrogenase
LLKERRGTMGSFETVTPIDESIIAIRSRPTERDIDTTLDSAAKAFKVWQECPLHQRIEMVGRAVDSFVGWKDGIAEEITEQIGRPIAFSGGEVDGFESRARIMLDLANEALSPHIPAPLNGFKRSIERVPLGTVVVLAPWNYPFLTAVNAVVPALVAGNAVILKHSDQTPIAAERMYAAFHAAGLPDGVFQYLHMSHSQVAKTIADPRVSYVCFTGSVAGGHAVQDALSGTFTAAGLELGGKDPAYIREDADLEQAINNIADGIFFNSGQSCCGIERVYVHQRHFRTVVDGLVTYAEQLKLGDPRDPAITLGPMVKAAAADAVRKQIGDAVARGARALVDPRRFGADNRHTAYLAPQILVNCDHSMAIMNEETFGPVAGVMPVGSDNDAIGLMNDSRYGLTASIWTKDSEAAHLIGSKLETGTVFMNRCDHLDPELAWTGVKESGRGATLSRFGYNYVTRPKSFHFKLHC